MKKYRFIDVTSLFDVMKEQCCFLLWKCLCSRVSFNKNGSPSSRFGQMITEDIELLLQCKVFPFLGLICMPIDMFVSKEFG